MLTSGKLNKTASKSYFNLNKYAIEYQKHK